MCRLRTRVRTDVDPPQVELPSVGVILSRCLRGDNLLLTLLADLCYQLDQRCCDCMDTVGLLYSFVNYHWASFLAAFEEVSLLNWKLDGYLVICNDLCGKWISKWLVICVSGWQEGHPACKNWVVGCWRGYLSGARCRLACGPADATATHCLLLQWNPDWFYLSGTGLPG